MAAFLSRLFGADATPEPARIAWVDPATLDLRVEWAAGPDPDRALIAEVTRLRDQALPNSWLPFCQHLVIGTEGDAELAVFDPGTVVLELDTARGRITVDSWLRLGRHCAELAPMPCTVAEWDQALQADRRRARRAGFRHGIRALARLREIGVDARELRGDKEIGARLNEIVNDGADLAGQSPERDFIGDCMCLVAERAGYPLLDLRGDRLRSVTDHGGCRLSRPSANERVAIQLICALMGAPVGQGRALCHMEHSNPNRLALLARVWPVAERAPIRAF